MDVSYKRNNTVIVDSNVDRMQSSATLYDFFVTIPQVIHVILDSVTLKL